jgi:predicted lysophospholipase L1 biosynthesis ABC-type transport system permease subunit
MNTIFPDPDAKFEWWLWLKLLVDSSYNPALFVIFLGVAVVFGLIKLASLGAMRPAQVYQEAVQEQNPRKRQQLAAATIGFLVLAGIAAILAQTTSIGLGLDVLAFGFLLFVIITELLAGRRKTKPAELPVQQLTIEDIISWKQHEVAAQPNGHTNGTSVYQHS